MCTCDIDGISVRDLPISERARDALLWGGVDTVGRIQRRGVRGLLDIYGFGPKSLEEVRAALATYGVTIRGDKAGLPECRCVVCNRKCTRQAEMIWAESPEVLCCRPCAEREAQCATCAEIPGGTIEEKRRARELRKHWQKYRGLTERLARVQFGGVGLARARLLDISAFLDEHDRLTQESEAQRMDEWDCRAEVRGPVAIGRDRP